ncbi:mariner transposase [Elysia marginata]|uniref:Mariner transposase n=1 Tax=Elysia marginata TaxID=1093978 RepID=A0AAV4JQJ8_9GAST|nr:mariner transposase [Elysia marginata]
MDETWIYQFDPEPKNASIKWRRPSSTPPKKAKVTQSSGKVMLSCFWDCDRIIITDYMEKGKTVTGEYYSGLLERLRSELQGEDEESFEADCCFCMITLLLIEHDRQLRQLNGAASKCSHILHTRRI